MGKDSKTYPTGFVDTALPLYQKLDADGFEQFCMDLLNLHPRVHVLREGKVVQRRVVHATRLLGGNDQRGGDIKADAEGGEVWIVQCKREKSFLPSKLKTVIEDAERRSPHVDQYIIATTCGLNADAQQILERNPKWQWWDSSKLTSELQAIRPQEGAINLLPRFGFGEEWKRRLFAWGDTPYLEWKEFFKRDLDEESVLFHHRLPHIARDGVTDRLLDFARDGAGRALILSAAGGQGKSRELLELARAADEDETLPRVRFLHLNRRDLSEEAADMLRRELDDLLLVVEDADRQGDAVEHVAKAARESDKVRLLVTTRAQAIEAVKSSLHAARYGEKLEPELTLPDWNSSDIRKLAEKVVSKPALQFQIDRLVSLADQSPLLVLMGGELINDGKLPESLTDESEFRERVFKGFKDSFMKAQPVSSRERMGTLIQLLSFVCPAPLDTLYESLAPLVGCPPLQVADDCGAFLAADLLVENREGVRLYPDLFSDAVLLDASLDHGGKPSFLHRSVLSKLPFDRFPSLLRNVAQVDWEARVRKEARDSLFEPIWREFLKRFEEAKWPEHVARFRRWTRRFLSEAESQDSRPDRGDLLSQWSGFGMFLPERTVELAELTLKLARADAGADENGGGSEGDLWRFVCSALPQVLKPVAKWHPSVTAKALDLLWSLDAGKVEGNWRDDSNPIAAIAEIGSFSVDRPAATSEAAMEWLEATLGSESGAARIRKEPWILNALLKPWFGRELERNWSEGKTVHFSSIPLSAEKTRSIRGRALALAESCLATGEPQLANAAIPVLREAISPVYPRFRAATLEAVEAWRSDRLEGVAVVERGIEDCSSSPVSLVQLRRIVMERRNRESDEAVKNACERVSRLFPDTLELRVARAVTSWAHEEFRIARDGDHAAEYAKAEKRWDGFVRDVAGELTERYPECITLVSWLRELVEELACAGLPLRTEVLLDHVAATSAAWSEEMLRELLREPSGIFDGYMTSCFRRVAELSSPVYREALATVPALGRPLQARSLIQFMGVRSLHDGGLNDVERSALRAASGRTEEEIVTATAEAIRFYFKDDLAFSSELLVALKPEGQSCKRDVMETLAELVETHSEVLKPETVSMCLKNLGEGCFTVLAEDYEVGMVAKRFPKEVYEHFRDLIDNSAQSDSEVVVNLGLGIGDGIPLGAIEDGDFLDREIAAQWKKARNQKSNRWARLALIGALIHSDQDGSGARLTKLVSQCGSGEELVLAVRMAAPQGAGLTLNSPVLVREFLQRGEELGVGGDVREKLRLSAIGGMREFTNGEPDPEYRHVLERSEELANKHEGDAFLGPFYRSVAESERRVGESHRQRYEEEIKWD